MTPHAHLHPLFDAIGGRPALTVVVESFYQRVLADPLLAPLFANTDMAKQRAHQVDFLSAALGGPEGYRGPSLRSAHQGRGITREHFAHVAGHLQDALREANVEARAVDAIMTTAASLMSEVVG